MNKQDLVELISESQEVTKKEADRAIKLFIAGIEEALESGETVQLVGFGTFSVDVREGREGINPLTNQPMKIEPSAYPKFIFGKSIKDSVKASNQKRVKSMLKAKRAKKR